MHISKRHGFLGPSFYCIFAVELWNSPRIVPVIQVSHAAARIAPALRPCPASSSTSCRSCVHREQRHSSIEGRSFFQRSIPTCIFISIHKPVSPSCDQNRTNGNCARSSRTQAKSRRSPRDLSFYFCLPLIQLLTTGVVRVNSKTGERGRAHEAAWHAVIVLIPLRGQGVIQFDRGLVESLGLGLGGHCR